MNVVRGEAHETGGSLGVCEIEYTRILSVNGLTLNRWMDGNAVVKGNITSYGDVDVICLSETYLEKDEEINLEGYPFYGHNHVRESRRGNLKGGVAILVR